VSLIALGRRAGYIAGFYNSCAYAWVAYENGLYGEVALNLLFFLPTGIIGLVMWSKKMKKGLVLMRGLSNQKKVYLLVSSTLIIIVLGKVLSSIQGQNEPYFDSATNVLSILATFLMMWRYKEQWILYMSLNIISIAMWLIRWYSGGFAGDLMVLMWGLYLINSFYGYWKWHKGSKRPI
jgi:nicotinamide mononucleotide transporter